MVVFFIVLIVLGLGLELFSLRDSLKNVEFEYHPDRFRTEPGEPLDIVASVSNHSRLPISYIRASIAFPGDSILPQGVDVVTERFYKQVSTVFRLWGRQRVQRRIGIRFMKRGIHLFDGATLQRGDFLGFSETSQFYPDRHEVLVYPGVMEDAQLQDALGSYCGDMIAHRHLIRDPIITMGVREYTGREAMKTISWSQSARRGELVVREFDYTRDMSCTVLLATNGLGPTDSDLLDSCCSIARTVCQELTQRGVNVDLYTNAPLWGFSNRDVWSCTAAPGRMEDVLETLARVYSAARCPAEELAGVCAHASESGTAFVLISPYDNDKIQAAVRILHEASGMKPLHITPSGTEG